jgi:hypothetical protein
MSGYMGGVGIRAERGISNELVYGQGGDRNSVAMPEERVCKQDGNMSRVRENANL